MSNTEEKNLRRDKRSFRSLTFVAEGEVYEAIQKAAHDNPSLTQRHLVQSVLQMVLSADANHWTSWADRIARFEKLQELEAMKAKLAELEAELNQA